VVWVKICGITNITDAQAAADAGADAIGLNFVGGPRLLDVQSAEAIITALPPGVTPVALVRLLDGRLEAAPAELLKRLGVSYVQLYGTVDMKGLTLLQREGFHPMPVIAVKDERFIGQASAWLSDDPQCQPTAIVLDAYDPNKEGGTGGAFCWDWIPAARQARKLDHWPPIILAGGLRPENVAEAIRVVRPYGVDVSSGVEQEGSPGVKDVDKMRAFVRAAKGMNPGGTT